MKRWEAEWLLGETEMRTMRVGNTVHVGRGRLCTLCKAEEGAKLAQR